MFFIIWKTKSLYFRWKADIRERVNVLKHMFGATKYYFPKEDNCFLMERLYLQGEINALEQKGCISLSKNLVLRKGHTGFGAKVSHFLWKTKAWDQNGRISYGTPIKLHPKL